MASGIYRIVNKINNHFYVGSTVSFRVRFSTHRRQLRKGIHHNSYLQNAWKLYREENFEFQLLRECSRDQLLAQEQIELDKFVGTIGCYNLSPSAFSPNIGIPRSPEVKLKISAALKNRPSFSVEHRKNLRDSHVGNLHTTETRIKMIGRPSSKQNIKKAYISNAGKSQSRSQSNSISCAKRLANRKFSPEEIAKIKLGVKIAYSEGRGRKNKIPKSDIKIIVDSYLSGMSQRQLATKYSVTSASMSKFLRKHGAK